MRMQCQCVEDLCAAKANNTLARRHLPLQLKFYAAALLVCVYLVRLLR